MTAPEPMDAHEDPHHGPVVVRLEAAVVCRRTREPVVHEHDAMPDEHLVFDLHPGADERVAGDLAAGADGHAALDLDKRPDARLVSDRAAVQIRERVDDDSLAE
jgi:hypothetical protein